MRKSLGVLVAVTILSVLTPAEAGADTTGPSLRLTGGALLENRWLGGTVFVDVEARDPSGVHVVQLKIDDAESATWQNDCRPVSTTCGDIVWRFGADTTSRPDGAHRAYVRAVDRVGNVTTSAMWTVRFDSTPPDRPIGFGLAGQGFWQSTNDFGFVWRNPPQNGFAEIAGARYELCPVEVNFGSARCVKGEQLNSPTQLKNLKVPGQGEWILRAWLVDQASNANPSFVTDEVKFGLDEAPPNLSLGLPRAEDPTALPLTASDEISGIQSAEIEVRRVGAQEWRPLPVEPSHGGLVGRLEDEVLPDGVYDIRARVVDRAGNERSASTYVDGRGAQVILPVRGRTQLVAGRKSKRRSGRSRLSSRPVVAAGATTTLVGRLASEGNNGLPNAPIDVLERVDLPGEVDRAIGRVVSSRTGRFSFRLRSGPRRRVRFRYAGTPNIRPATADVLVRVRARSTLRVNRRSVVNGEDVVFRGRLLGRPLPVPGKLIKLQVRSRGRWLTFATPRADSSTGLWSHRYRFAATRGRVRYRFRAVVPSEGSYPFDSGATRQVAVRVRGI